MTLIWYLVWYLVHVSAQRFGPNMGNILSKFVPWPVRRARSVEPIRPRTAISKRRSEWNALRDGWAPPPFSILRPAGQRALGSDASVGDC